MRKITVAACALLLAGSVAFAIEGDPIPGVGVKVGRKPPGGGIIVAQGTTDAEGRASFKGLKKGTYFVRFADADRSFEIATTAAGNPLTIRKGSKEAANRSASAEPAPPPAGEKFTTSFSSVAATIEIVDDTLTVTLFRPGAPSSR
jgi:hypothetical protein